MRDSYAIDVSNTLRSSEVEIERQIRGRDRCRPHVARKLYHAAMGLICFSLYAFLLTPSQALIAVLVIGGPLIILDLARLRVPKLRSAALQVFGSVMRCDELNQVSGNSFYVLGLLAVVIFFSKPIALLCILYLALGDPAAAIIGTAWGRHRVLGSKKSVEGAIGNFLISALASFVFALAYGASNQRALTIALVGGLSSMIAECLPIPLDDNLTVPVISGLLLSVACTWIPLF
jgi:diacylglycerol kinase (CTP)